MSPIATDRHARPEPRSTGVDKEHRSGHSRLVFYLTQRPRRTRQRFLNLQAFDFLQSRSRVARQRPSRTEHLPFSLHTHEPRQPSSLLAMQSPSLAVHAPQSRHARDRSHPSSVLATHSSPSRTQRPRSSHQAPQSAGAVSPTLEAGGGSGAADPLATTLAEALAATTTALSPALPHETAPRSKNKRPRRCIGKMILKARTQ